MSDRACMGDACNLCGPSWWGTQRGCYEHAKRNYATNVRYKSPGHTYKEHTFTAQDGRFIWKDQEEI